MFNFIRPRRLAFKGELMKRLVLFTLLFPLFVFAAVTPIHTTKTVTTAGTRIQAVTSTNILPSTVYFEAAAANTGFIYIGLVTVTSTIYMARLSAGQSWSISSDVTSQQRTGSTGIQLSSLYIDSSVNGEKVQMTYVYPNQ